jgi:predicted component of type VI protein secretion system
VEVPVFLIGSAHDCDLVLADPAIPEVHTYVYVTEGGVSVRRLGEGPTIAIDGREVQTAKLVDGQRLKIGSYEFAIRIDQPQAVGRTPIQPPHVHFPATAEETSEPTGVVLVRGLLDDIRKALQTEARLQLFAADELPWRSLTAGESLLIRRESA